MKPTVFDPAKLDVAAFATAGATLEGRLPLASLQRLASATVAPADGERSEVVWSALGLCRKPLAVAPELRVCLRAQATVHLTCQRCLQPMAWPLDVDRTIRFVPGEDEAARLDEESEEDVLSLSHALNLAQLIEDELILALPIVPRHDTCPRPIEFDAKAGTDFDDRTAKPENPFAVLATLKPGR